MQEKKKILSMLKGYWMRNIIIVIVLMTTLPTLSFSQHTQEVDIQSEVYGIHDDMPKFDDSDISLQEFDLITTIQVNEPLPFVRWLQKIGSVFITQGIIIKQITEKKYRQVKAFLMLHK